ncbi:VanZ family protein [Paenibacillus tianjinensis]|uniref:VanZ family protein n=1 Tax=Paenibacillus tianjinensis TaxID=2810347 RepID=A0ABX7LHI7_9BACL|nr:VanZ family protein [Paenibacillus tianjinensis]QSF46931.1 VanZ family protein [Paenibacillus tianjinensis]
MKLLKFRHYGLQALYAGYIYILFKIILFKFSPIDFTFLWHQLQRSPDTIERQLRMGNLIPLATISNTFHHLTATTLLNFIGNIVLFLPFGLFTALLSPNRSLSLRGLVLRAFGLSALLECAQGLFSIGTFDVDDLILNTFGGMLGYGLFRLWKGIRKSPPVTEK